MIKALVTSTLVVCLASLSLGCGGNGGGTADESGGQAATNVPKTNGDSSAAARRFKQLKSGPTDGDLGAFYSAATKIDGAYLGAYHFNLAGPEKTDPVAREKRIKEVMHAYMCGFFDDSIDIANPSGTDSAKKADRVLKDLDFSNNATDADPAPVKAALEKILDNPNLDLLSGSASGNNTMGNVLGIYDVTSDDIVYFGFTNCGSDD